MSGCIFCLNFEITRHHAGYASLYWVTLNCPGFTTKSIEHCKKYTCEFGFVDLLSLLKNITAYHQSCLSITGSIPSIHLW